MHQARVDTDRCQSQSLSDDLRHVILIVKKPLLALRYQLPDGRVSLDISDYTSIAGELTYPKIRRIQMNFRPASGCDTAFETLKGTGIFVVYKDQPAHVPPPLELHAQSSQTAVTDSEPRLSQEQQRRLTATAMNYNNFPTSTQLPQLRPNSSQAALASSQPSPQGYQHCYTTENAPSCAQPARVQSCEAFSTEVCLRAQPENSKFTHSKVLPSSQPRSQEYSPIAHGTTSFGQPPRSPLLSNFSENRGHPNNFDEPISYVQDPRSQHDQPSSNNNASYTSRLGDQYSLLSTVLGSATKQQMLPPASRELLPSPTFGDHLSAFGGYAARPVSAPETVSDSQLVDSLPISQMLPPQRVLPFPEKPPSRDAGAGPASTGEQSTTNPGNKVTKPKKGRASATPKPSPIVSLPNSSAPTVRRNKATAAKSPSNKVQPSSAPSRKRTVTQKRIDNAPPSSAPPRIGSTLKALERTVSKITEDLTPPSSRGDNERRPLTAVNDSEMNERQSQPFDREVSPTAQLPQQGQLPELLPNIQPAEMLDSLDGWIRKYHGLPVPQAPMTAKEQLAEYAAKPDAVRAKMIDDMILECLQDENFGKLCDDVEKNWKRICLGF